ncbi:protein of unknown function [Marinactinospora thermotolerans DSM 45154]|uniref:DUF397 domain-containing protein n=1 Tax=Marinactinospora thermotolerans DSM 45154 TaxID=1122192 RepID=A0A1T4KUB1_9ACTN|nr:protein of unknown function [Marinactinospora thermotolerans DSM 45154]
MPRAGGSLTREMADLHWWKSSHSNNANGCVETARHQDGSVALRDSRNPEKAVLGFQCMEWCAFLAGVRKGLG